MCFNKEWSLAFTLTSCGLGAWVMTGKGIWKSLAMWQRCRITACFLFFAAMEILQFFQYLVINDCDSMVNIVLTALGYIHICWQPIFSNLALSALDVNNFNKEREILWQFVLKFGFAAGLFMSLRILIPAFANIPENFIFKPCSSYEGLCGEKMCTTNGIYHLKWTFKLLKSSYYFPNTAAHFLFMFVAPFVLGLRWQSIVLFLTGPFIATLFRGGVSDGERSAIWCFFSICESFITIITAYYACKVQLKDSMKKKNA
ncbi:hypothetical protein TVAG_394730 [Trichomonas vaginalis G3]|uniref:Transmembrane protein n=1 Tax=Trichomonas vaginalis (strain ATCC PRA-98 / G3) TaxID=412133 RepID=A2EDD7_TRIV3|nr:Family of unknown function (DUF5765) family [Trichomonas vaginalis G3]EAY09301.1 hypothetical protein TVAG_394730 [Trichomonas vaginalis G3]KAI5510882.1 Family of unknown function (DUF5765) family [Trichomonas vaginalis G3]|eukprot:XP_001321524.1 hypothetical protein [Trichomonas vaginalis G3]